jgi:hypothetical protein
MKKIRIKITGVNHEHEENLVETVEVCMELLLPEGTQFVSVQILSDIPWEYYEKFPYEELPGEEG